MRTKNDWSHDLAEILRIQLNWSKRPLGEMPEVTMRFDGDEGGLLDDILLNI